MNVRLGFLSGEAGRGRRSGEVTSTSNMSVWPINSINTSDLSHIIRLMRGISKLITQGHFRFWGSGPTNNLKLKCPQCPSFADCI